MHCDYFMILFRRGSIFWTDYQ